jgi:isoaspartyl peptidase/L-asparaginase-like protein (Ntn-hydrolase superfamily)
VASATDLAIRYFMDRTDSEAGLIMVDRKGQLGFARSTTHMPVCGLGSDGQIISEG